MDTIESPQTVTSSGAPVKERIPNIAAARAVYNYLKESDVDDAIRRAEIKGMIDGNKPFSDTRLKELGLGYLINVNFLEMRAILDTKASAHYELFFEVPTLIDVRPSLALVPDVIQAPDFGSIVAEEYTKTLFDWSGFLPSMDRARREADGYGVGLMLFRDEYDWRPKAYRRANFLPDPTAGLDIDELTVFCLEDEYKASELIAAISDERIAKEEGWNVAAVKKLLVRIFVDGEQQAAEKYGVSTWEDIQQKIRNNDWTGPYKELEPVRLVQLVIAEVDTGEISQYIFARDASSEDDKFLFSSPRRFKKMSQVLWWLPYNNGDGYLKSIRGLASMIYNHCDLSNRFMGRMFDAGFMIASLLLQPKTAVDMSQLQLVRMGVVTVIPPELQAVQSSFQPQISHLVQLRDLSASVMKNNTGVFRQNPELFAENQPEKTARQVVEEVAKEARMEKANIAFDLERIQWLYREIFRRLTNPALILGKGDYPGKTEAISFVNRCVRRGVPIELMLMPGAWDVYITKPIGMGSWGTKMDISNKILQARGLLDEAGRVNATRDWLAVLVGYRNVDRYLPVQNRDKVLSNEHSIATLENNDLAEGQAVQVGSDQRHAYHFYIHALPVQNLLKVFSESQGQGVDVQKAANMLLRALPHMNEHLKYLALDPTRKDFVANGAQVIQAGVQLLKVLEGLIKKQMQQNLQNAQDSQAAQAAALTAEKQVELVKVQGDLRIREQKEASLNQQRVAKTKNAISISQIKTAEGLRLQAEKQAAELAMNAKKLETELAMKQQASAAGGE